jgi:hypothetical protein
VVAVKVSALVQFTFQIAVLRSSVNSAPGADVISSGSVRAKVTVKIEASSSVLIGDWVLGDGDGIAGATVVNVYVSVWPFAV